MSRCERRVLKNQPVSEKQNHRHEDFQSSARSKIASLFGGRLSHMPHIASLVAIEEVKPMQATIFNCPPHRIYADCVYKLVYTENLMFE